MDAKYNRIIDHPLVRVALQCAGFVAWMAVVYALMSAAIV